MPDNNDQQNQTPAPQPTQASSSTKPSAEVQAPEFVATVKSQDASARAVRPNLQVKAPDFQEKLASDFPIPPPKEDKSNG